MQERLRAEDDSSPIDCVIANAGVVDAALVPPGGDQPGLLGRAPNSGEQYLDITQRVTHVNYDGVINTVRPLLDRMRARGGGSILIVSSLASLAALPATPGYCTSKGAATRLGQCLRAAFARDGVRVSTASPGYIDTDMAHRMAERVKLDKLVDLVPLERAVRTLANGVAHNQSHIIFPARLATVMTFVGSLPLDVLDWLSSRRLLPLPNWCYPPNDNPTAALRAKQVD